MSYYYYGYNMVMYDLPIFILFFGLTFITLRMFMKKADPIVNTGIAAVAASLAYILIRENAYKWIIMNRMTVFGVLIGIIILIFAFFAMKFM